jgi:hypothetical protein
VFHVKLTNVTDVTINVPVKGPAKDGNPAMDSVAPGETKNLSVDPANKTVKGILFAGGLVAEQETAREAAEAAKK